MSNFVRTAQFQAHTVCTYIYIQCILQMSCVRFWVARKSMLSSCSVTCHNKTDFNFICISEILYLYQNQTQCAQPRVSIKNLSGTKQQSQNLSTQYLIWSDPKQQSFESFSQRVFAACSTHFKNNSSSGQDSVQNMALLYKLEKKLQTVFSVSLNQNKYKTYWQSSSKC